jgi:cytochrome P450
MLLAHKPALQEQLRNELHEGYAGKKATKDSFLSSTTMVALVNETFRMFPAIPILSRVAVAEDRLGETGIQAGQKVLLSIIGLHHDSKVWPLPSKMDIGRFPDGDPAGDMRKHLIPFSAGPRVCGGSKFAVTEISVAIATLLRHLQLAPVEQQPVRFQWGASMRHRDGIKLIVAANAV